MGNEWKAVERRKVTYSVQEEIVRAPRGKLFPEAGDRPAPGREAPAHYLIEGAGISVGREQPAKRARGTAS